eukprot:CAMPEP_0177611218 /NCGR_PEP_ID=MMETSP0419_2-20121207/20351_1 /TAXON_ID=582737 /ORGANISM="Tetraselmis sp., Strain GSL018" /LENGTH=442 /DNA_ID=CAMNT_0019106887 /DNA_START=160 /DNA_END=1488 /DNA_ORIENTATION=+
MAEREDGKLPRQRKLASLQNSLPRATTVSIRHRAAGSASDLHRRQPGIDIWKDEALLVLGVGIEEEAVAHEREGPWDEEGDQQSVAERLGIVRVPIRAEVRYIAAVRLPRCDRPLVAVKVLRDQPDNGGGTGRDRHLHAAVIRVDHASDVLWNDLREHGADARSCTPTHGEPHDDDHRHVLGIVLLNVDVRQPTKQHHAEDNPAEGTDLRDDDPAVVAGSHARDVAEETADERGADGGRQAEHRDQDARVPVAESQQLEPQREVPKGKPRHRARDALHDDDLEAADPEDRLRLDPHAVGDGPPAVGGHAAAGVDRADQHGRPRHDAHHRDAEVGKAPPLCAVRPPAADVGGKDSGKHPPERACHVEEPKGLPAHPRRVVVGNEALAAGDDKGEAEAVPCTEEHRRHEVPSKPHGSRHHAPKEAARSNDLDSVVDVSQNSAQG